MITMFLLIFAQKDGVMYLQEGRILFAFKVILLFFSLFLLSYISKHISIKSLLTNLTCTFLVFSSLFLVFNIFNHFNLYKNISDSYLLEKEKNYIQEKIYRYYLINNIVPKLDSLNIAVNNEDYLLWMPDTYDDSCNNIPKEALQRYYYFVYNVKAENNICFSKSAIEQFYNSGGYFTDEELSNIVFNRLYDDNYVLNSKGTILDADYVTDIMKSNISK